MYVLFPVKAAAVTLVNLNQKSPTYNGSSKANCNSMAFFKIMEAWKVITMQCSWPITQSDTKRYPPTRVRALGVIHEVTFQGYRQKSYLQVPRYSTLHYSRATDNEVSLQYSSFHKLNSVAWVHERIIPTEQPPLIGEVSAEFCG
jgi:hypothetical protein